MSAGTVPVTGPGLSITADDAPEPRRAASEIIRDERPAPYWSTASGQAGAEAVAINGARLTPLTRISYAGEAITVDRRSISPPYIVQAIGDPDTLPARLQETARRSALERSEARLRDDVRRGARSSGSASPGEAPERLYYAEPQGDHR